jgi:hypothetical protein
MENGSGYTVRFRETTWIANVNDPDSVIPAEVCELDGGDGETV